MSKTENPWDHSLEEKTCNRVHASGTPQSNVLAANRGHAHHDSQHTEAAAHSVCIALEVGHFPILVSSEPLKPLLLIEIGLRLPTDR